MHIEILTNLQWDQFTSFGVGGTQAKKGIVPGLIE